jgi:Polyketide cyclase / dehydrase and lipid transport
MRAMKHSIHIEAPVERVFDFVFDYYKDRAKAQAIADLMGVRSRIDDVKATKEGVGSFASWHMQFVGLPVRGFTVVTDVDPPKHLTERVFSAMSGTWDSDFEPEGSGTKLTMELHPGSFWRIPPLHYLMDVATARMNDTVMRRLKDTIEAQGK